MTPYYSDDRCTIYHGDARTILPTLGTFDLLLTDPPYGIDAGNMNMGGYASSRLASSDWDKKPVCGELLKQCVDSSTDAIVWGGNYFDLPPSRCFLVWDKTSEIQGRDFAECEIAWCSWDAVARIYRYSPTQMKKSHKTQKPVGLMRWCLGQRPDAETIVDTFMGVGSTLDAAKTEGRTAVGIEINEAYCEKAANRLSQGVLF